MTDDRISRLFEQLRRDDEARLPGYRDVLGRSRPDRRRGSGWRTLAAVCAALVLVAAGLALSRRRGEHRVPPAGPSLSQWKAPTDVFLDTPGRELLTRVPQIATAGWSPSSAIDSPAGLATPEPSGPKKGARS